MNDILPIENASLEKIDCPHICSFLSENYEQDIQKIIQKLRVGGSLTIGGVDFLEVCKYRLREDVDGKVLSSTLKNHTSFLSCDEVREVVSKFVKIMKCSINSTEFCIKAVRLQ